MSTTTRTLRDLADDALRMPWEDRSPIMARLEFQQAVTAEVFVALCDALVWAEPAIERQMNQAPTEWSRKEYADRLAKVRELLETLQ
jgi:hypothetical protein